MTDTDKPANAAGGPDWGQRLRGARQAKQDAAAVFETTVRDANAAGLSGRGIARELGQEDRTQISAILRRQPGEEITAPTLPTVVYLIGAGHGDGPWREVRDAMHARGWVTVSNSQQAWQLSRGGCRLILVDFSAHLAGDPVRVELRRAVEGRQADQPSYPVKELLPTMASIALQRAHPEAADFQVSVQQVEAEWKVLAGGLQPRPERYMPDAINTMGRPGAYGLDGQQLARYVADLLE